VNKLLFLLLLLSLPVFSQKGDASLQTPFRIDSLPVKSIILSQGWTWHAGDNPDWAKPALDDSKWEPIDPTQDIDKLPQLKKAGIGWLRLRLKVDTSLLNQVVGILVDQVIASEIYLDGQRVVGFGKVSRNPEEVEAYNPSGSRLAPSQIAYFNLGKQREQVLSVRFAIEPGITYFGSAQTLNQCFQIRLNSANRMNYGQVESLGYIDQTAVEYLKIGIFLILALLHFTLYRGYRPQKANLYFGIYCFVYAVYYLLAPTTLHYIHSVSFRMYVNQVRFIQIFANALPLLAAVYSLFSYSNKRLYRGIVLLGLGLWLLCHFKQELIGLASLLYGAIIYAVSARVSIWAIKKKKEGARYILFGTLGFAVSLLLYILESVLLKTSFFKLVIVNLTYNFGLLCVPISMALYLAREFVQTSVSLQHNLNEVKQLSAEKEQILTTQNETLERQVSERTAELNQSLAHLRTTQTQLIQKEKLASLGELTAGIAHEIQNPLNFVNNFSELSVELAQELKEEAEKPEIDKELIIDLARDLTQNQEKINLHGKRASSIVKGMLEHSRITTGERQLTDINQLADEYLRLAYHGLKAKVSNFECELMTDFDPNLPKVEVVPQEIGRVLLNLINNGFYAVQEQGKRKTEHGILNYKPTVTLRTKAEKDQLIISVKDNGNGIPEAIKDKIFQPFFTTKPTGEGTGLGLSLSYDIITKGHGGTMEVETKEGEGTTFLVKLPI
jgi:two-component system NtrC family sensor kinase